LLALRLVLLSILGLLALLGILSLLSVLTLLLTAATTTATSTSAITAPRLTRGLTLGLRRRFGLIRFWSRPTVAYLRLRGNLVIDAGGFV